MTPLGLENELKACLRAISPRDGFAAELLVLLTSDHRHIHVVESDFGRPRGRWIVAGAAAVSATGALYVVARRRHQGVA